MFRTLCAHHQEVKIVLYSIWYHHTCRWPSGAQLERRLKSSLKLCTISKRQIFHKYLSHPMSEVADIAHSPSLDYCRQTVLKMGRVTAKAICKTNTSAPYTNIKILIRAQKYARYYFLSCEVTYGLCIMFSVFRSLQIYFTFCNY